MALIPALVGAAGAGALQADAQLSYDSIVEAGQLAKEKNLSRFQHGLTMARDRAQDARAATRESAGRTHTTEENALDRAHEVSESAAGRTFVAGQNALARSAAARDEPATMVAEDGSIVRVGRSGPAERVMIPHSTGDLYDDAKMPGLMAPLRAPPAKPGKSKEERRDEIIMSVLKNDSVLPQDMPEAVAQALRAAGLEAEEAAAPPPSGEFMDSLPPASKHKGGLVYDTDTGQYLVSDGKNWVPREGAR